MRWPPRSLVRLRQSEIWKALGDASDAAFAFSVGVAVIGAMGVATFAIAGRAASLHWGWYALASGSAMAVSVYLLDRRHRPRAGGKPEMVTAFQSALGNIDERIAALEQQVSGWTALPTSSESERVRNLRTELKAIRRATSEEMAGFAASTPISDAQLVPLLRDELVEGERLKANCATPLTALAAAAIRGGLPTSFADVENWEDRVESLLRSRPRKLARFKTQVPDPPLGMAAAAFAMHNDLSRRLEHRLSILEKIIQELEFF